MKMSTAVRSEHDADLCTENVQDEERIAIRDKLSTLSFEELQELKERLGARVYREAMFGEPGGASARRAPAPAAFKRENKNRPREISSKKPVSMIREVERAKKKEVRDPRFDPLCGDYDKKTFHENYSFVAGASAEEREAVRAELRVAADPARRAHLTRLLQRLADRARGRAAPAPPPPTPAPSIDRHFTTKKERRVGALVQQYEALAASGQLEKHIRRRRKKTTQRARKRNLAPPE